MTLAIDRKTGAVMGQYTSVRGFDPMRELSAYMQILTAGGYRPFDPHTMRLERTGD